MVHVKGGDFLMGSDDASLREAPKHRVEVDDFYICRYECSVAEWYGILGETCNGYNKDSLSAPIVNICWDEAMAFVVKLNEILPGAGFALPHEKEWEYAAAGGCLSVGCEYSGGNDSSEVAWTLSDSLAAPQVRPSDGISWWKESNELGIFNMSGNVAEFCENRFYYYSSPQKEFAIDMKVIRGGSFTSEPVSCRIFSRDLVSPEAVSSSIGFRLVLHLK
jgi:formylglycine-generating enzyme required for sulfatase activity